MAKLCDLGKIVTGNTPKTSDTENYSSLDIPFVKPSDILEDELVSIRNSEFYISEKAREKARIIPPGSILVTCIGIVGKVAINQVECAFNQQINVIIPDAKKCDAKYVAYAIQHLKPKLQNIANAAVVPIINKAQFSQIEIVLPSLDEQHRIAAVLDKVTDLIAQRRAQLDKLDLLVKSRFVEMFGEENKYTTAEKACNTIVDCPHSTPRYTGQDKIYPSIRTSEIKNGQIDWTTMLYVDIEEYESRTKRLKPMPGDIVYAREGTYGDCVILPEHHKFCLGQRTMLFRPDYSICTSEYLHQALRSNAVKRQADESNAGSTVPHVNVADAKKFTFPLPPLAKQKTFSVTMQKTNQIKNHINRSLEWLEVLKKSLMQQYFE